MKRYIFILLTLCFYPLVFSQSDGWNYLTLGPSGGIDIHESNSFTEFSIRLDHFKQIKGEDIYSIYKYQGVSFNYGYNDDGICNYSMHFYLNVLRKRLFEYYDRWYYKQQNLPPEKRKFIHITGLRLYPTVLLGPAAYNFSGDKSIFIQPGAGFVLNYGHLSTWNADYRLILSYQYNLLVSGKEIPRLKNNILSAQIGIGFKLK